MGDNLTAAAGVRASERSAARAAARSTTRNKKYTQGVKRHAPLAPYSWCIPGTRYGLR